MPTFNREHFLPDLFNSLTSQSYPHWECIIVDDGSEDHTQTLVQNKSMEDNRFHFHHREQLPKGAQTCRNIGIDRSTGDYIIFLDSDDFLLPFCLKERLEVLRENYSLDFIVRNGTFCDKKGNVSTRVWNIEKPEDDLTRFLFADSVWQTSGGMFNSAFIKNNKIYFDTSLDRHQDVDFHIQVLMHNPKYRKLLSAPADYVVRRHGADSISQQKNADFSVSAYRISKKIIGFSDRFPLHKDAIQAKYYYDLQNLFFHKHFGLFSREVLEMGSSFIDKVQMVFLSVMTLVALKYLKKRPTYKSRMNQLILAYLNYPRTIGFYDRQLDN